MADNLQQRLVRMSRELNDLKTAQKKPANLKIYSAIETFTQFATKTITYKDDGLDSAPIIYCSNSAIVFGEYNSASRTQTITYYGSPWSGTSQIRFYSSREVLSIA